MKGALVFLLVFVILLVVTIAYADLPPGRMISDAITIDSDVEWSGFPVITLTSAVFNGVIYGIIAWLIFSIVAKARKR